MNKGATFESYVHFVYDAILNLRGEKIQVSRNTVFRINERESYEIDIYYEFVHAGVSHRVAVECKDWRKPVDQGQVLLFHQKIKNIGDEVVGVFVSRAGYQSGAIQVAKRHGILTLTAEELPSLGQIVGRKIHAAFIPEEHCIGEPFWYIAALSEDGRPDGNFYALPDDFPVKIPLFISREQAEAYRRFLKHCQRYKVYGMAQYKLRGFLAGALLHNMPIGLVFDYPEPNGAIRLHATDAASINRDFLLEPIVQPTQPGPIDRLKTVVKGLVPARRRRMGASD
jgi:hypothetical protein